MMEMHNSRNLHYKEELGSLEGTEIVRVTEIFFYLLKRHYS